MVNRNLLVFIFLVFANTLFGQDFKVVGYFPYYRFEVVDKIDFTKITHLNLAFVNPDIDGNLSIGEMDINPIINQVQSENPDLKVFISLAGGGVTEEWRKAYDKWLKPENRSEFVHLLVDYMQLHKLDGIDVDLEWDMVNENYSPFVIELRDSLKFHGKEITAAFPGTHRYSDLSEEALNAFDVINLMAYDKTGPWRPNDPGPHSPESFAIESIDYWRNQGVGDEKITLGVPFYGWDFTDQNNVKGFTFGSMVSEDENFAYKDRVGERYYNGIPTIQSKTYYALNQIAGVMIWEIGQDAFGTSSEFSLLSAIDYVVKTNSLPITGIDDNLIADITVFPNPFHNEITISAHREIEAFKIRITDLQGRELKNQELHLSNSEKSIDLSGIQNGIYVMQLEYGGKFKIEKLLKN